MFWGVTFGPDNQLQDAVNEILITQSTLHNSLPEDRQKTEINPQTCPISNLNLIIYHVPYPKANWHPHARQNELVWAPDFNLAEFCWLWAPGENKMEELHLTIWESGISSG